jgi:3'-5' exoribonuclease
MRVREMIEGCEIAQPLHVRDVVPLRRPDGDEMLKLKLGDRTGTVVAVLPGSLGPASREACRPGAVVWVTGVVAVDPRLGAQIEVRSLREAMQGEYEIADLMDGPSRPAELMESDLRQLITTIQNAHLRRLLTHVFGEGTAAWECYRDAPAAKHYHQAYRHGLLEHSLTVAQAVSATSAIFPGIDRDIAVTGALLHDIGKLEAYETVDGAISMSDRGRLQGEIALGYYRVRQTIELIEGFPPELEQALVHIILSHHGTLEHGSPVVPCTREATLVHMMDNLGGRLGSFDRLEKQLGAGSRWSPFDKGIGAGAYFPPRDREAREAA